MNKDSTEHRSESEDKDMRKATVVEIINAAKTSGRRTLTGARVSAHGRYAYMYMFCVESSAGMGKAIALIPEGDLSDDIAIVTYYGDDGKVKAGAEYFYVDDDGTLVLGKKYVDNFCETYQIAEWDDDFYYGMYPGSEKIYA